MRIRRVLGADEAAEILRLVGEGLTAREVAAQVHRSDETVRRIARTAGATVRVPAASTKAELTQAEADALREKQRRVHASGPQMGVCVACGFWRRLDGEGRLPAHDHGPAACQGSGRYPMRNPIDD